MITLAALFLVGQAGWWLLLPFILDLAIIEVFNNYFNKK